LVKQKELETLQMGPVPNEWTYPGIRPGVLACRRAGLCVRNPGLAEFCVSALT